MARKISSSDVEKIYSSAEFVARRRRLLDETVGRVEALHAAGETPVIHTSRVEKQFADYRQRLAFGAQVSAFLMDVVHLLPVDIGYLISKGDITSNDVLSSGLALATSRALGQILTGCSVVRCPDHHPRYPGLPAVIFPGNVGDAHGLATVYRRLTETQDER